MTTNEGPTAVGAAAPRYEPLSAPPRTGHIFEIYGDGGPDDYGDPLAEWCRHCGRLRSDIETAEPASVWGNDRLDEAWDEVQAVLPAGWILHLVDYGPPGPYNPAPDQPFGAERYEATAKLGVLSSPSKHRGREATPQAALRALARSLRSNPEPER